MRTRDRSVLRARRFIPPGIVALLLASLLLAALPSASPAVRASNAATAPELTRPADRALIADSTPTFAWKSVSGAASYRFEIGTDPTFAEIVHRHELKRRVYTLKEPLAEGVAYLWRVGAIGRSGAIVWSDPRTLTIGEPVVNARTPNGDAPVDVAAVSPTATNTARPTRTVAPTRTPTATRTASATASPIPAKTATRTPTTAPTATATVARTPTKTPTTKPTSTATSTKAATATRTPTKSPTIAPSKTATKTRTPVPPPTATRTGTPTRTPSATATATATRTAIPTGTATATVATSAVQTPTATASPTPPVATSTSTSAATATATATATSTSTPTSDPIPTATASLTPAGSTPTVTTTATPTIAGTPTATETATATGTPTKTPTVTPTATPTMPPVVGGIARNPSFENGQDYWYLENGTDIIAGQAHGGGHAVELASVGGYADQHLTLTAGNTYQLSAWGKIDGGGDTGYIGVVYRDALGQRLSSLEPPMLAFTQANYTQKAMTFTVPASVSSVAVFAWKRSGAAAFLVDDVFIVVQAQPAPTPAATPITGACQRLMALAYFYPPTGMWDTLISGGSGVNLVVLNIDSGPSTSHQDIYDAPVANARAAGMLVIGYIRTLYGTRDPQEVIAEMDRYYEWYGVTSFFLDEADTDAVSVPLYQRMVDHAHALGGIAVLNFGYKPDRAYVDVGDILIVFESPLTTFNNYTLPAWIAQYPANKFGEIVYNVPADQVDSVLARTRASNIGYVWVTDDPYDRGESTEHVLPSYWTSLNQKIEASCT